MSTVSVIYTKVLSSIQISVSQMRIGYSLQSNLLNCVANDALLKIVLVISGFFHPIIVT